MDAQHMGMKYPYLVWATLVNIVVLRALLAIMVIVLVVVYIRDRRQKNMEFSRK